MSFRCDLPLVLGELSGHFKRVEAGSTGLRREEGKLTVVPMGMFSWGPILMSAVPHRLQRLSFERIKIQMLHRIEDPGMTPGHPQPIADRENRDHEGPQ